MYCPKCRSEYREGFVRCADCDLPLVFEADDPSLIPVADSLLRSAGIEFLTKNERLDDEADVRALLEQLGHSTPAS